SPPLLVRLADEADVAEPQVPEAAVDQLRGRTRRPAAEVAAVHERHGETVPRRRRRDPRADDAAADHEQVEALGREPFVVRIAASGRGHKFVRVWRFANQAGLGRREAEYQKVRGRLRTTE